MGTAAEVSSLVESSLALDAFFGSNPVGLSLALEICFSAISLEKGLRPDVGRILETAGGGSDDDDSAVSGVGSRERLLRFLDRDRFRNLEDRMAEQETDEATADDSASPEDARTMGGLLLLLIDEDLDRGSGAGEDAELARVSDLPVRLLARILPGS